MKRSTSSTSPALVNLLEHSAMARTVEHSPTFTAAIVTNVSRVLFYADLVQVFAHDECATFETSKKIYCAVTRVRDRNRSIACVDVLLGDARVARDLAAEDEFASALRVETVRERARVPATAAEQRAALGARRRAPTTTWRSTTTALTVDRASRRWRCSSRDCRTCRRGARRAALSSTRVARVPLARRPPIDAHAPTTPCRSATSKRRPPTISDYSNPDGDYSNPPRGTRASSCSNSSWRSCPTLHGTCTADACAGGAPAVRPRCCAG